LLFLPQGELHRHHKSKPPDGWIPHDLRDMPLDDLVGRRGLQPQQHTLPADRRSHHRSLRQLPHQQCICWNADRLLLLPQGKLHRNYKSKSRDGWIPHHLRHMPFNNLVGGRDL
jgi:hypothetical protein